MELVRRKDHENCMCCLLLPKIAATPAIAIRAFNAEVAQVQDQVSDLSIGLARLQFWSDVLDRVYNDNPPDMPVAKELHRIIRRIKLSKHYLKRLVEAREQKLRMPVFPNMDAMERYVDKSFSSVYFLILEAQGIQDVQSDHVASHLGKAQGISSLLRSVSYNAKRQLVDLPQDILLKHGVSAESVLRRKIDKNLRDAVFEISSRAKLHLDKARELRSQVHKDAHRTFLAAHFVESYLERLRRLDFDVFHPSLQRSSVLLTVKILWWAYRRRY